MRKQLLSTVAFLLVLATGGPAFAQLQFPPSFGAPGQLKDGLDKFRKTDEGKAEEAALLESGVKITITSNEDKKNYGSTKVTARDAAGKPTAITINIASNDPGGANEVADTIKHEFRHAEIDIADGANERANHDKLHQKPTTDQKYKDFQDQLKRL